jgi:deoxyribodipyrimidine photolyase-related protein
VKTALLIFPHQLFKEHPFMDQGGDVFLVEEFLFFKQFKFHQQKIAFHRASMKSYANLLNKKNAKVTYIDAIEKVADVRILIPHLKSKGYESIHFMDPTDDWLSHRLQTTADEAGLTVEVVPTKLFINERVDRKGFFNPNKKKYFQTSYYKTERKRLNILMDGGKPKGGKWTYDDENRKKYPVSKVPPEIHFPANNVYYDEAINYVNEHFTDHPGQLEDHPLYPIDHDSSKAWMEQFFNKRFAAFGPYEDAIVADETYLHHSVLSPLINVGLLTPEEVLTYALDYAEANDIELNTIEGFVRQLIGWREFIRGIYECKGREERTKNFWKFKRKMPASFYDGTTGILPVDHTIKKVLKTGYCHHIERLMVLGNIMLLCEIDPDEIYRWFMELFIDAYDWVMVPNVYGMSQFADGGLMSTKPYISSSNYLMKMSDYPKGDWQDIWDALFWRFMHVHRDFFSGNPRLGLLLSTFDRMDSDRQSQLIQKAEDYISSL